MSAPPVKVLGPLPRLLPHVDRFRAEEHNLGREVELRVLAEGARPVAALFEAEMNEMLRLDHPAFLPVMRSGRTGDRPYYTVPLRSHATLDGLVGQAGFGLDDRVAAVTSLAGALAAAHLAGLTLGPVRLSLTCWDPERRVAGFLHHRSPGTYDLEPTLGFAPRDLKGGTSSGPRADLFLWGLAAYRILSGGQLPYPQTRTLVPIRRHVPTLAADFAHAVEACLAIEPELRPETGAELYGVLGSLAELTVAEPPPDLEASGTVSSERVRALVLDLKGKGGLVPPPRRALSAAIPAPATGDGSASGPPLPLMLGFVALMGGALLVSRSVEGTAVPAATAPASPVAGPAAPAGGDPYIDLLAKTKAVTPEDFWRLWRIAYYLAKGGRLPGPGMDLARLEAIKTRFSADPPAACRELEALIADLRGVVGAAPAKAEPP